jgi:excisionase family DNA binding protein
MSNILDKILKELKKINKNLEKLNSASFVDNRADDLPDILTVKDVSKYMRVNLTKTYEFFHREDFPSLKVGNRYLVPKSRFLEWLDERIDK